MSSFPLGRKGGRGNISRIGKSIDGLPGTGGKGEWEVTADEDGGDKIF